MNSGMFGANISRWRAVEHLAGSIIKRRVCGAQGVSGDDERSRAGGGQKGRVSEFRAGIKVDMESL